MTERGREPPDAHTQSSAPGFQDAGDAVVQGTVERVTYRRADTGYAVLRLTPERGYGDPELLLSGGRVTAVGAAHEVAAGLRVRLRGTWSHHARHGRQFRFASLVVIPPLDREGLIRYFASSTFRGVGPKLAARVVEALGSNALAAIREDPDVLLGIPGLRRAVREELVATVRSELGARELLAFLYGLGLGPGQAELVQRKLGHDAEARLRDDPYVLARGIPGIGFQTADRVARRLDVAEDAPERRRAALLHVLREAAANGHVLRDAERLVADAEVLLELRRPPEEWDHDLDALARLGDVVLDRDRRAGASLVYLPPMHTAEVALAKNLEALRRAGPVRALADRKRLAAAEHVAGLRLHAEQREAVLGLLREPVALLTGGPGVGKTTIVRLVCDLADANAARVVLASPTGRAAKRLAEACGRDASTVHRLLGWEPGTKRFLHDARNPIEADLVVVDEISMLDLVLAHHLVKAIQPPTRLLLVGDPDQLPSVSPGNVLADLLRSERMAVLRLTHVHRQEAESLIVSNAHRLLAGQALVFPDRDAPSADCYFFPAEDEARAADRLIDVVTQRIPARFDMEWWRDVQVLSPMYRGACGVDALNLRLRGELDAGGSEIHWHGRAWRLGDRVIHTRNDYERMVFNGDMGHVARMEEQGPTLTVRFPERSVVYVKGEIDDLQLAFAITVHRSQGGEYRAVVMPVVPQHWPMLQRNLLYTALTRAKELVVIVGSKRALQHGIENAEVAERESALAERLRETAVRDR